VRNRLVVAMAAAFVLVACTAPFDTDDTTPPGSDVPGSAPVLVIADGDAGGAGLSVAGALENRGSGDLVAVSGALFVDPDGTAWLCDAIAESFPPQCGGDRIEVGGLELADVPNLQEESDVRWSESVTLVGSVE